MALNELLKPTTKEIGHYLLLLFRERIYSGIQAKCTLSFRRWMDRGCPLPADEIENLDIKLLNRRPSVLLFHQGAASFRVKLIFCGGDFLSMPFKFDAIKLGHEPYFFNLGEKKIYLPWRDREEIIENESKSIREDLDEYIRRQPLKIKKFIKALLLIGVNPFAATLIIGGEKYSLNFSAAWKQKFLGYLKKSLARI